MKENKNASNGVGFTGLLAITFIVLKLTHVVEWSWLWVLSPILIPVLIVLVCLLIIVIARGMRQ